jgi:hypothetical protein
MIASSLPKSAGSACGGVKPTLTGQQFKAQRRRCLASRLHLCAIYRNAQY